MNEILTKFNGQKSNIILVGIILVLGLMVWNVFSVSHDRGTVDAIRTELSEIRTELADTRREISESRGIVKEVRVIEREIGTEVGEIRATGDTNLELTRRTQQILREVRQGGDK